MSRIARLFILGAAAACLAAQAPAELERLRVLHDGYPRAYFFRSSEGLAANPAISYEDWEKTFSRLMGIEGKVLDEEVPGRSLRNIQFFTRFKKRHPEQLVLLHYNGNARDPRFELDEFFAGHFLYYNGARITASIPAEAGETDIPVEDARLFRTGIGRYRNSTEDVGLCALDARGRPNWIESEQVQLISVDAARKVIRVRRGCYGTKPRAFSAGASYAAAHVSEGPWGEKSHLMWDHNFSTACPRDAKGRTLTDVLVEDIARRFLPGGALEAFDGLQFDVLKHQTSQAGGLRGVDSDADGKLDKGYVNGVNAYGIGVIEFCKRLRERLPPAKLLLADAMGVNNQRAFQVINGIESEGFPHLRDLELKDWSGGLNRHFYWALFSKPPIFNYVNHKFNAPNPKTGLPFTPDLPFSAHRMVFAAAVFTDAAVCYSLTPKPEPGERIGIWDELHKGVEHELAWLGRPLAPPVRLAAGTPNLLPASGGRKLIEKMEGAGFRAEGESILAAAPDAKAPELRFLVRGIPVKGPDLTVFLTMSADRRKPYPGTMARIVWASLGDSKDQRFMSWVGGDEFESVFYFRGVSGTSVDLEVTVEGPERVRIEKLTAHAHPDAIYRLFEKGLVLANPGMAAYPFALGRIAPGAVFRRLRGSPNQDPRTNNGAAAGVTMEVPARDALFLVRENARSGAGRSAQPALTRVPFL